MKVSVVGAGALGTFYATMLSSSGQDVTLVCREKDVEALRRGTHVEGLLGADARPAVATSPSPSDLFIITVKAYDIEAAVRDIKIKPGTLVDDTLVVVIHNGLGGDAAAAGVLGEGHVAVGIAYGGATFLEPGRVRLAGYTETVLGSAEPAVREKLPLARDALEGAGLKARIVDDVRAAQW
ncbi:MAG TPA: 2-dehydropantoate 2-reductase N-terminal domain-containing protein, partial [Methanocella sp.]|nr:2-dehydropantoate 2-reductase N-terminal domain-containing protein [Methanocella sp.]